MESEQRVTVENPDEPKVGAEEPNRNGAVEMQQAASRTLAEKAQEIVGALLGSALQGHIQSVKFLFQLAQGGQEHAEIEGKPKLRDVLAAEWEADKKWFADMAAKNAKAMASQCKPE
jgi:hypothetical protein